MRVKIAKESIPFVRKWIQETEAWIETKKREMFDAFWDSDFTGNRDIFLERSRRDVNKHEGAVDLMKKLLENAEK